MARGNGTGPMGMGSRTGRGAGFCNGYGMPGFMNVGRGRAGFGRGFGMGGGHGYRNQFYATGLPGWGRGYQFDQYAYPTQSKKAVKDNLKAYVSSLQEEIQGLNSRISELDKEDDKDA